MDEVPPGGCRVRDDGGRHSAKLRGTKSGKERKKNKIAKKEQKAAELHIHVPATTLTIRRRRPLTRYHVFFIRRSTRD